MNAPARGQVYRADLGHGPKPWVVLSNNARNRQLDTVVAARITTSRKPALPTIVPLVSADPLVGAILVDDLMQLYRDELTEAIGTLCPATMARVSAALRIALP